MLSGQDVMAILVLETSKEPRLNLLDLDWVQRLAEHASIAIANAQLYTELTRANESKSEFVGFAAHELKNPLTSVKGYTDTLISPMGAMMNDDQRKEFLNVIRSNADRMQIIIEDLRDIAKIDAGQLTVTPKPIHIRDVVTDTLQAYQPRIDAKNQTLVNTINEDLPLILGDKMRLVQVLTNLVSNANKYSAEESEIVLEAAVEANHRDDHNKSIGPALRVSVRDNGMGIAEEDLQKIFRVRYFRSTNPEAHTQPGTGLGMMISQEIIQQHKGRIWVESTIGEGTTFHFVVPLAPEKESGDGTATPQTETVPDEVSGGGSA
jgi:signal transduction histidine kinase